mgnify:CR=1 FL=1
MSTPLVRARTRGNEKLQPKHGPKFSSKNRVELSTKSWSSLARNRGRVWCENLPRQDREIGYVVDVENGVCGRRHSWCVMDVKTWYVVDVKTWCVVDVKTWCVRDANRGV